MVASRRPRRGPIAGRRGGARARASRSATAPNSKRRRDAQTARGGATHKRREEAQRIRCAGVSIASSRLLLSVSLVRSGPSFCFARAVAVRARSVSTPTRAAFDRREALLDLSHLGVSSPPCRSPRSFSFGRRPPPADLLDISPLVAASIPFLPPAIHQLLFGTVLVLAFTSPVVGVLDQIGDRTGIPSFFVAFILAPMVTNGSEILARSWE